MKKNKGFTLVELMVVIVIIGILAALAIPKLLAATSKAKLSEFKPILKTVYTLQETYLQEQGAYSTDADGSDIGFVTPTGNKVLFTYAVANGGGTNKSLGVASMKSGLKIKLATSNTELTGTGNGKEVCVDTDGVQRSANAGIVGDASITTGACD